MSSKFVASSPILFAFFPHPRHADSHVSLYPSFRCCLCTRTFSVVSSIVVSCTPSCRNLPYASTSLFHHHYLPPEVFEGFLDLFIDLGTSWDLMLLWASSHKARGVMSNKFQSSRTERPSRIANDPESAYRYSPSMIDIEVPPNAQTFVAPLTFSSISPGTFEAHLRGYTFRGRLVSDILARLDREKKAHLDNSGSSTVSLDLYCSEPELSLSCVSYFSTKESSKSCIQSGPTRPNLMHPRNAERSHQIPRP